MGVLLGNVFDTAVKTKPSIHIYPQNLDGSLERERRINKAWPPSHGWPGKGDSRGHHRLCLLWGEGHLQQALHSCIAFSCSLTSSTARTLSCRGLVQETVRSSAQAETAGGCRRRSSKHTFHRPDTSTQPCH